MKRGDPHQTSAAAYVLCGVAALVLLAVGFGVWATQARLTAAIGVQGLVQTGEDHQIVQHPTGGVVAGIFVREGELVKRGALLVRLDTKKAQAAVTYAQEQYFDLAAQQERLKALYSGLDVLQFPAEMMAQSTGNEKLTDVLEGQQSLFRATQRTGREQRKQVSQQIAQIKAQIAGLNGQSVALEAQLRLIGVALDDQRSLLSRGLTQAGRVLDLEREVSRLQGDAAQVAAQKALAAERINGIEIELLQRDALLRERSIAEARALEQPMRQLRGEIEALQTQISDADIRAPAPGVVYKMQALSNRAVLGAAEPLLYLVAQGTERLILAPVPPRHIDRIEIGQQVKLRLSALDQVRTPEISGTVSFVSADSIVDAASGQAFFEVKVRPEPTELAALPDAIRVMPGMPVEVFFETGTWSPLRYLTKPVADYFARALREG